MALTDAQQKELLAKVNETALRVAWLQGVLDDTGDKQGGEGLALDRLRDSLNRIERHLGIASDG
jgi:hypothetical protein